MNKRALGHSGLSIAPLIFGGNVFGWTADQKTSFDLLDAFVDAGFGAIDTADVYSRWIPTHQGGESENMIGEWLAANPAKRDKITLLTKVGMEMEPEAGGLSRRWIVQAVEDSLRRLRTDVIDLYQSHCFDPDTPQAETLEAYESLLKAGKIRAIGCSNFDAAQIGEALHIAETRNLPHYATVQPRYNLHDRKDFEMELRAFAIEQDIAVIPFHGLAAGFLTGKYRSVADKGKSPRGAGMDRYMTDRGFGILAALDNVAKRHEATPAEIALAWLLAQPAVTAPIASATSLAQLASLVKAVTIVLSEADLAELNSASES